MYHLRVLGRKGALGMEMKLSTVLYVQNMYRLRVWGPKVCTENELATLAATAPSAPPWLAPRARKSFKPASHRKLK